MPLEIANEIIDVIRELRPTLDVIKQHDKNLYDQLRRSLSSVSLNISEGEWRRNGNASARFDTAMGSTNESIQNLKTADAFGYVKVNPKHIDTLDRIARTLNKLIR